MLDNKITVGIGTDGPASNNDLDMFEEMRLAALLAKVQTMSPTALPAKVALYMATLGGAKVNGLEKVTGSLEAGKAADIIIVDAHPLHNSPHYDFNPDNVYSQLVYAAKASDVAHTMVRANADALTRADDHQRSRTADRSDRYSAKSANPAEYQRNVLSKLVAVSLGWSVQKASRFR